MQEWRKVLILLTASGSFGCFVVGTAKDSPGVVVFGFFLFLATIILLNSRRDQ